MLISDDEETDFQFILPSEKLISGFGGFDFASELGWRNGAQSYTFRREK